ncbi:uncharacterized protein LOC116344811 [Contarinia nasturtii]|uniref:uncharacterized protein LOC116344811 n=1 Tax=Contarinia nasturtii TaxID=265458 RepID=UPI0012D46574|nr:uncharacterized protein LOC116344811 [Contarinia nasturtii]XP_031629440.1 uncharacterized protein LOC116344811 [Contarinia nasturtii]XP_031629441.1 uncharacterized protein LOC116344811 [Contarinia nasturtii]
MSGLTKVVGSSEEFDTFEESMMKRPMYTDQHHCEIAFHRFSLLRAKNLLTDAVILSSDDKRFNVHSNIMAGKSDYFFNTLLNAVNNESENVTDEHNSFLQCTTLDIVCQLSIDSLALEMIITFCYSGAIELTVDNVESMLIGARELAIDSLTLLCSKMLGDILDRNNCIQILEIADKQEIDTLREKSITVISAELPNISRLPEFYLLNGYQMYWLIELLSNSQNGIFDDLLKSLNDAESSLPHYLFDGTDTHAAVRAAFIIGYFQGTISQNSFNGHSPLVNAALNVSRVIHRAHSTCILNGSDHLDSEPDFESEEEFVQSPPIPVLVLLKRKTIQFNTFCDIEQKWEKCIMKVDLMQAIESFRDAVMIPVEKNIVIFNMRNGFISQAQSLSLNTTNIECITLPIDIECARLALFCTLNNKIYCFARSDQQYYNIFDTKAKLWSSGQIDDVMDAKYIVGVKNELYFIGCGFMRTTVRSYHIERKQWTSRGLLRIENKENCFKATELNGSIFVVMSCFDSAKMYNGTEFVVQRYDENVEDWIVIKKIYFTHYVDYFHLDVIGGCLYLFYSDGEVQIYNEEQHEWQKGPTIDYNVLDVSMCMIEAKEDDKWAHK